jgi:hypothetical protein
MTPQTSTHKDDPHRFFLTLYEKRNKAAPGFFLASLAYDFLFGLKAHAPIFLQEQKNPVFL